MRAERLYPLLGAALLLGLGLLAAQALPRPGFDASLELGEALWEGRALHLLTQALLMFVGALGIRALLPREDEE